ncbi:filamentous hemagglutinin N-terminal domain-containing protein [Burkholderia sp. Bp8963]|uniref:two-partner secretion domain-containing protein n=1 Tax=Burkholderia sp. Bp8963 TaxID=2184547 RepID=UPI000F59737F|nr:GLUG motif-containing protein [Burkholderia sp. Bp8963]RQS75548.1 filamentous hemagglutinin N-terminal domain-containing protein [Burkholderia sp. Bp8963]
MNKTYVLVWNGSQGIWQVAGERVRRRGKSSTRASIVAVLAWLAGSVLTSAHALPVGENVVSGKADIHRFDNDRQMSINQHTDKLITEWTSFSVDGGQRVTFNQPSTSSIALNRVVGRDASQIRGNIDANGRVFLVNPNGILFGSSAQVNVGGLVASTLGIKNEDFEAGRFRFVGAWPNDSTRTVTNHGQLTASEGGAIALLGAQVMNGGTVFAQMGTIALGAGSDVTLNFDGRKLLGVQIDKGVVDALVSNNRLLKADGGLVLMSAKAADTVLSTVVNNQGSIEARTLRNTAGRIVLDGNDAGVVNVAGSLNASAGMPMGDGGTVETRGADVRVALGAMVDTRATNGRTGVWRIASSDMTIQPGANQPGTIVADTLSRNLGTTNVELVSERGNLSANGPVTWASDHQLKLVSRQGNVTVNGALRASGANAGVALDAAKDVLIAAPIALTGVNAKMTLDYGGAYAIGKDAAVTLSGLGAGFESNGLRYTVIHNLNQLQAVNANLDGLYVLGNDIAGSYYGTSFQTLGGSRSFAGVFDGLGNTLSNLTITSSDPYAGLFGSNTGRLANLNLKSLRVSASMGVGATAIGGLVGENRGSIANVTATGMQVSAGATRSNALGGLVGVNRGQVDGASFTGTVSGNSMTYAAGGLIGENDARFHGGDVSGSTANAMVSGGQSNVAAIGGFVGLNRGGKIRDSSSLGNTNGASLTGVNVGGFVGTNLSGKLDNVSASGRTTGGTGGSVGGLAGFNGGDIVHSNSTGVVDGRYAAAIGGFVGLNLGKITDSKAMGAVSSASTSAMGGFVGINEGRDSLIDMAEAHGTVSGGQGSVGGFVGRNVDGTISHSVARGKTTGGSYSKIGGFVGLNEGNLADVDASGDVVAGSYSSVGGFAGVNSVSGSIKFAAATGDVRGGTSSEVGGFAGVNDGHVSDASASGPVTGGCYATLGGLIGLNSGAVKRSVASGRVNGSNLSSWRQTYGGLVGVNRGEIRYSGTSGYAAAVQLVGLNQGSIE